MANEAFEAFKAWARHGGRPPGNTPLGDFAAGWDERGKVDETALERLRTALFTMHSFVAVMFGEGEDCIIPETVTTPIGVSVKIGEIMREAKAALAQPAATERADG